MIFSWFTDSPEGAFSSYYQYDNKTMEFTRIPLELGRNGKGATDTVIDYEPTRAVGFSKQNYLPEGEGENEGLNPDDWSIDDQGKLCYQGTPLPNGKPADGDYVYDATDGSPVAGSRVTVTPTLPEGIAPEHLALVANNAVIEGSGFKAPTTDAEALVKAIQDKVCDILKVNVDDFGAITDQKIFDTLKEQAKTISDGTSGGLVDRLNGALKTAEDASVLINEQLEEDIITPDAAFTKACISLQEAIDNAQATTGVADVKQALTEISNARQAVNAAIQNIDTAKSEFMARQLDIAKEALTQARQHADDWRANEEEYEKLAEAPSLDEYKRELGLLEGEEVVV